MSSRRILGVVLVVVVRVGLMVARRRMISRGMTFFLPGGTKYAVVEVKSRMCMLQFSMVL